MKKKSKRKKILMVVIPVLIVAVGVLVYMTRGKEESIRDTILAATYDFGGSDIDSYKDYMTSYTDNDYLQENTPEIKIEGKNYSSADMSDISEENGYLLTGHTGSVTYTFDVEQPGLYNISVDYKPLINTTLTIVRNLYVDGKVPFAEAEGIEFNRLWNDDNKDFLMNTDGNQSIPLEVQKEEDAVKKLTSADHSTEGDFAIYFSKGQHSITLESLQASMGIKSISLIPAKKLVPYEEYYNSLTASGIQPIADQEAITVQGEDTFVKSSPSILPQNNRTSTKTQPYHPTYIVYNTIGGESWSSSGDSLTWQIDVPKEGLYKIGVRFRQALNRGFYSIRELRINGELPFAEAAEIQFPYDTNFQLKYLGNENGDYFFYLKEGINTITMTATLASLSEAVSEVETSVKNMNTLYRELTAVMGINPDQYRDYNILSSVPNMVDVMKTEYVRLDKVIKIFGEDIKGGTKTSDLSQMMSILEKVIKKPETIAKHLRDFNDKISALSSWMLNLGSQPLELDYFMLCPQDYKLGKAEGGFFAGLSHTWKAFLGSFTNDYEVKSGDSTSKEKKTLNVWITTATRSQYDIVQGLVNEHFKDSEYRVKLSMVNADTLLPSTVTGNGPDVAIQLNYSVPTNFAYRDAAYDLSQFPDFEEVVKRFAPATMEYMEYNGGYYGLPDEMTFPVLFYRKDILKQLNLEVPQTWEELQEIIPYLEAENMSIFMTTTEDVALGGSSTTSTKQVNPLFLSMLYQNGIELYTENQTKSNLGNSEALQIFKVWTEYYTKQGLDYSIDIVTRFRTGQTPLLIADYTYRNKLLVSAPEIEGEWTMAPLPGTKKADGTIDRTVSCLVGGSMIIRNSVEKDGMANEAWDFLKWWTDSQTQQNYNMELKAKDGAAAEYPMANLEALESLSIDSDSKQTVLETVSNLRGVPQVPGGYITGRTIVNVFLDVITNNQEPVDAMYMKIGDIDAEIAKKRREFGLTQ